MKINWFTITPYLLPFACFSAAANALLPGFINSLMHKDFVSAALTGFGHSYVIWACLVLALVLAWRQRHKFKPLNQIELLLLFAMSLMLLIPTSILSWFACTAMALLWHKVNRHAQMLKVIAIMLVVISLREPMCQILLNLFAEQILTIDAWLSGTLLSLSTQNVIVSGNTIAKADGHTLLILTGCSAFNNLSLAMLLWFCLSMYLHNHLHKADYLRLVILLSSILIVNTARLALMAVNSDWYHNLHDGHSQEIIDFLTINIALLCIRRGNKHEQNNNTQAEYPNSADHRACIKNQ